MKRSLAILALALLASTALAADNAVIVTPGAGVTMRTTDVGSLVQSPNVILSSILGAAIYGTAGTANANVLSVQGIASMTPLLVTATQSGTWNVTNISGTVSLPTGASTSANQPSAVAAAGAATSGSTGNLAMGAVTTGSPTYTTANTNPLSLDTSGNLRVNVVAGGAGGGAVTVADGADVTQGAKADAVCASATANACSEIAMLKFIANGIIGPLATGSNTIGNVGAVATPTGGATPTGNIAPANTTAVVIKASAGTLYGIQLAGIGSVPAYLKLYNSTSSCGGTPVKRLIIPAAATAANGAGSNISFGSAGVAFTTGITYCVSTDITDTNSGAPAASTYYINIDWN